MEVNSKLMVQSLSCFGLIAILSIQLSFLIQNSHGMKHLNLTAVPTTHPDDVEKVWPDFSCHSPTFKKDVVKAQMDACLDKPYNRPHYSICQRTCAIKGLKFLMISKDNKTLMASPNARKQMLTTISEEDIAKQLLTKIAEHCSEMYIQYTYEERVLKAEDDSDEALSGTKMPRPCDEWGPFLECVDKALKCP